MKITELRCSACDGTLKVDENNPNFAECEYCHTKFTIEWDHPGTPGRGDAHLKQIPARINYIPIPEREEKKTGWEPYGWKRGIAVAILGFVLLVGVNIPAIYRRYKMDHSQEVAVSSEAEAAAGKEHTGEEADPGAKALRPTGLLAFFSEIVFGRPMEEITESELAKIQWLEIGSDIDFRKVGYSFDDPLANPDAELTWVKFPRDDYPDADLSCLPAFTGLKRIGTNQSLSPGDVRGLSLTAIRGYFDSMEQVAALLDDPSALRYLDITSTPVNLQGIEQFAGLETLVINSDQIDEVRNLVNMKSLKTLSLDMYDGSMDFSIFGMMPWLESLTVRSQNVRDLGFVSKMNGLKALCVENGAFLTLAPLAGCTNLEELSIKSCDELKDMSAVSSLTGLKKLALDLPYGCPEPDLGGLGGIRELYLESFDQTGFLKNMSGLETLTLDSCETGPPSDFDNLPNLKSLKCTSFGRAERDYGFIAGLSGLEEVDLHGTITYGDISGIFNLPALKRLNISNMECEINFDKIAENTTLESLSIDSIKLYKNVQVSGGGGIVYVDWDDVNFTEHLTFLEKLKGLKELSIRENELTEIGFAASLGALESIDFADNYVTDLSPLSGLKALSAVDCSENPISNYEILGDSVVIIR